MVAKRQTIVPLITLLSVCVGLGLLAISGCKKAKRESPESEVKDIGKTKSCPLSERAKERFNARWAKERSNRPDSKGQPSGPERIKAHHKTLQIPPEELETLSAKELIHKVYTSPLAVHMIMYPRLDGGLSEYRSIYNGVNALLKRPAAARTLLDTYKEDSNHLAAVAEDVNSVFCFTVMEVLMSSDEVMQQVADAESQDKFLASIVESRDLRAEYDARQPEPVFGEATLDYTALAISKLLNCVDYPEYKKWYAQKLDSNLFVKRPCSYEESKELMSMARKYVQSQEQKKGMAHLH